jgi:hypothetical protein
MKQHDLNYWKIIQHTHTHTPSREPLNEWYDYLIGVYIIIKKWTNSLLTLWLFNQSISYVSLVITYWHVSAVQQPTVNCSDHVTLQSVLQEIFTLSTVFVFQTIQNSLEIWSLSTRGREILEDEGTMFIGHITKHHVYWIHHKTPCLSDTSQNTNPAKALNP